MNNPANLKYSNDHEWVKVDGDIATIGITDYAQELLTDIVYVELPALNKQVSQNGNLGVVESVKSVSDVFCPISGEVIEVNTQLESAPELINHTPYTDGWIAKIKMANPAELNSLKTKDEYEAMIQAA